MESGGGMAPPMRSTYSGTGSGGGGLQRTPSLAEEMAGLSVARSQGSMRMTRPGVSLLDAGGSSGGSSCVSMTGGSFTAASRTLGPAPIVSSTSRRKSCLDPSSGSPSAQPGSPVAGRRKSALEPGFMGEMRSTYSGTEHSYGGGDAMQRLHDDMGGVYRSQGSASRPGGASLLDSGDDLGSVHRSQASSSRMARPSAGLLDSGGALRPDKLPSIVKR